MMLTQLSTRHVNITVTPLEAPQAGYEQIKKCGHCKRYNGIRYDLKQLAA